MESSVLGKTKIIATPGLATEPAGWVARLIDRGRNRDDLAASLIMKASLPILALLCSLALPVCGEGTQVVSTVSGSTLPAPKWDPQSKLWKDLISEKPLPAARPIELRAFTLSGPVLEGVRPLPRQTDLSRGRKILNFPVVRLFVPQRMPSPPGGGGNYFAWGESARPWTAVAARAARGDGYSGHGGEELRNGLMTLGW
jgi:hypothetical protein